MRDTLSDIWARVDKWVSMSDYLNFVLTGALVMSFSQATRTYAFDPQKRTWIDSWVAEILPKGMDTLPVLVPTGEVIGYTTTNVLDLWGLPEGVAVVAGGHDHPVGAIGAGVMDSSKILDSMGTAELIYWPTEKISEIRMKGLEYGYTGYAQGPYYLGAGTYTGMTIKALCKLLQINFLDIQQMLSPVMDAQCASAVMPNRLGEPPHFNIDGINSATTPQEIFLAAFRASAYVTRASQAMMCNGREVNPTMVAIGGGAIPAALQIKADVLQNPVFTINDREVVAVGAANIAERAVNGQSNRAIHYDVYYPDIDMTSFYDEAYQEFMRTWGMRIQV